MTRGRGRRLLRRLGWAGVDEAGRGPLAGPVVAAAVIVPKGCRLPGLDDSKRLTADQRAELRARIEEKCVWSVALASVEEINRLNILRATFLAMQRAIEGLAQAPCGVLVDGNHFAATIPCPCETVVKGDGTYAEIAAASILAKTHRDELMRTLDQQFPGYGFAEHFGYATPEHLRRLEELGPCPIHRTGFAPVQASQQLCLILDE
ncbi:MAG: ribonuclease HII [Armatimonadetes bacterium]|nr:MAG: ribonuclease HII [Armatimonadota bacterium]